MQHTPLKVHRGAGDFLPNLSQRCVSGSSRILPTFPEGVYRDGLRRMLFHQRDYTKDGRGADGFHRCAGEADTHWGSVPASRQRIVSVWRSSRYFYGPFMLFNLGEWVHVLRSLKELQDFVFFFFHLNCADVWTCLLAPSSASSLKCSRTGEPGNGEFRHCGGPLLCWVKCHFWLAGCSLAPMTYSQVKQRSHFI